MFLYVQLFCIFVLFICCLVFCCIFHCPRKLDCYVLCLVYMFHLFVFLICVLYVQLFALFVYYFVCVSYLVVLFLYFSLPQEAPSGLGFNQFVCFALFFVYDLFFVCNRGWLLCVFDLFLSMTLNCCFRLAFISCF